MDTKHCPCCDADKLLSAFHKNRSTRDGYHVYCKQCRLIKQRAYRATEGGKAKDRRYAQSPKGKAASRRMHQRRKKKPNYPEQKHAARKRYRATKKGRIYRKKALRKYRKNHQRENRARVEVMIAVRSGDLPPITSKQCIWCGEQADEYHHWHGYEEKHWLDVIPLCIKCHGKAHTPDI